MYIHGSFLSQQGDTITVHIVTGNDRTQTIEIGTEKADVYFSEDPAEIENEVNDTFDVLLRNSAKIRLLCGNLITNLFSTSCRDAVVNIYKNDTCIFAGFIEPQTLSQPYNDRWDELELNCIDALSALQYSKYKNVGALGVIYAFVKAEAAQRSFYDIATEILQGVTGGLDILGNQNIKFWYDGRPQTDTKCLGSFLYLICCFWAMMKATFGSKTKCWRNFLSTLTYISCRTALTSISFRWNPSRRHPIRLFGMTS